MKCAGAIVQRHVLDSPFGRRTSYDAATDAGCHGQVRPYALRIRFSDELATWLRERGSSDPTPIIKWLCKHHAGQSGAEADWVGTFLLEELTMDELVVHQVMTT